MQGNPSGLLSLCVYSGRKARLKPCPYMLIREKSSQRHNLIFREFQCSVVRAGLKPALTCVHLCLVDSKMFVFIFRLGEHKVHPYAGVIKNSPNGLF